MVSRTPTSLRFTAGIAAALSMMGVGATALRGTVFDFHAWPQASGSNTSYVELAAAGTKAPAGSSVFFTGGSAAVAARLSDGTLLVQGGQRATAPSAAEVADAQAADGGPGGTDGAAQFDAGAGSSGTGSDQGAAPATDTPEAVGVPIAVDTTGDGVTDTWRQSTPIVEDGPKSDSSAATDATTTIFSVDPPKVLASPPTPVAAPQPEVAPPAPVAEPQPEVVAPPTTTPEPQPPVVTDPPPPEPVVPPTPEPEPTPVVDPPAPVVDPPAPVVEAPVVEAPPAPVEEAPAAPVAEDVAPAS